MHDRRRLVDQAMAAQDDPHEEIEVLTAGRGHASAESFVEAADILQRRPRYREVCPGTEDPGRVGVDRGVVPVLFQIEDSPFANPTPLLPKVKIELHVILNLGCRDHSGNARHVGGRLEPAHDPPQPPPVDRDIVVRVRHDVRGGLLDSAVSRE
jgi:hypothetical protein